MENLFPPKRIVNEIYDLKGSTEGRTATEAEKQKKTVVLKDLDFKRQMCLGTKVRDTFLEQITKDCQFLESCQIMDYSLLVLVHKKDPSKRQHIPLKSTSIFKAYEGGIQALDENGKPTLNEIYYVGIIDILQPYNIRKQLENVFKSLFVADGTMSCVPPDQYSRRFRQYVSKITK